MCLCKISSFLKKKVYNKLKTKKKNEVLPLTKPHQRCKFDERHQQKENRSALVIDDCTGAREGVKLRVCVCVCVKSVCDFVIVVGRSEIESVSANETTDKNRLATTQQFCFLLHFVCILFCLLLNSCVL